MSEKTNAVSSEKRLSREEEERLWMISAVPFVPVVLLLIIYLGHLKSIGVIPSFDAVFVYTVMLGMLGLTGIAATYEVVSSFKAKRSLGFRVKRFLSRTGFAWIFMLGSYSIWSLCNLWLRPVLSERHILLLSLVAAALLMFVLVANSRTRSLIKKLTKEEA